MSTAPLEDLARKLTGDLCDLSNSAKQHAILQLLRTVSADAYEDSSIATRVANEYKDISVVAWNSADDVSIELRVKSEEIRSQR